MTFICFVVGSINPFLVISNLSKSYVIWFIICSATATINKMIVSLYCAGGGGGSWWYWWLHCVASIETHCPSLLLALLLLSMCSCLNCWRHQTSAVSIFTRTHSTDKYGVESIKDSSVLFNFCFVLKMTWKWICSNFLQLLVVLSKHGIITSFQLFMCLFATKWKFNQKLLCHSFFFL